MGQWIIRVFAASMLSALCLAMCPGNKKIVSLVGGLVIILAAITPLAKLTYEDIARQISRYQIRAEEVRTGVSLGSADIMAAIIQEQTEAYILDKAYELGLTLQVEVTCQVASDGWPYPAEVHLTGEVDEAQKSRLATIIRQELAIGPDRQEWS